jgi:chromosome segregation ATPase
MRNLNDHEGYAVAYAKQQSLKNDLTEVNRKICAVQRGLQAPGETLEEKAARYLTGEPEPADANRQRLRMTYDELLEKVEVLTVAIRQQKQELTRQHELASAEICKAVAPQWSKLAEKIRKMAGDLAEVGQQEHSLRQDLERGGVLICGPVSRQAGMSEALIHKLTVLATEAAAVL